MISRHFLHRFFSYLFAFLLPPLVVGVLFSLSVVKDLMIQTEPAPLTFDAQADLNPPAVSKKPTVLILLSNAGTQISDALIPYEIFSQSGAFQVYTVAPEKKLSPLTGSIAVFPDFSFENAPPADLLIIPAVVDFQNERLTQWIHEKAETTPKILLLCEGARLGAIAKLLDGKKAATHFLAQKKLQDAYPQILFQTGERLVEDGKIISTGGVTSSIDASFYVLEKIAGAKIRNRTQLELGFQGYDAHNYRASKIYAREGLELFLRGGLDWFRKGTGVLIYPGLSEISLASILDTLPRSLSIRTVSVSKERKVIRTLHGLSLVPNVDETWTPKLDLLVIPSSGPSLGPPKNILEETGFAELVRDRNLTIKDFTGQTQGQAYAQSLAFLEEWEGPSIAALSAKLMEFPWQGKASSIFSIPARLFLRVILIGLFGMLVCYWLDKRLRFKSGRNARPPQTG